MSSAAISPSFTRAAEMNVTATPARAMTQPDGYYAAPATYTLTSVPLDAGGEALGLWTITSAWPNHPALLPPLPRETRASQLDGSPLTQAESPAAPATRAPERRAARERREVREPRGAATTVMVPARPATRAVYRTPTPAVYATPAVSEPTRERPRRATRHSMSPATSGDARPIYPATRLQTHTRAAQARAGVTAFPMNLDWPSNFDDWMIDIMRRRALRLNSGARRRGALGSVRAVELAHIMEQSRDANGHWICAICKLPVTLDDLSFDHIVALADGGEHAAYNLAPTHRKCNEIKGSEKAQYRAQSLDRWLAEWSTGARVPGVVPALAAAPAQQRYA